MRAPRSSLLGPSTRRARSATCARAALAPAAAEWAKVRAMEHKGRKADDGKLLSQVASRKKKLGVGTSHGVCRVGIDGRGGKFNIFKAPTAALGVDDGSRQVEVDAAPVLALTLTQISSLKAID